MSTHIRSPRSIMRLCKIHFRKNMKIEIIILGEAMGEWPRMLNKHFPWRCEAVVHHRCACNTQFCYDLQNEREQ
jgi:hypothetical protein